MNHDREPSEPSNVILTLTAIEAHIARARRLRAMTLRTTDYWQAGVWLGFAIVIVVASLLFDHGRGPVDHATTASLQKTAPGEVSRQDEAAPMRAIQASAVIDPEEALRRLCTTAESCIDVAPPERRLTGLEAAVQSATAR